MRTLLLAAVITCTGFFTGLRAQNMNADSLFSIGADLYGKAEYSRAADFFEQSAEGYLQKSDSLNWAQAILRQGGALMNRGEMHKARDLLLFAHENQPKNATNQLKARINKDLGRAYRELEQYELSKKYYNKGIQLAESTKDSSLIATLNNNISYPYLYSGDYDRALSYQKKAKKIYESIGEDYNLSFVLNGIFRTLYRLGLHSQANKYIRQSTAIREKIGNPNLLDVAYHNMAVSFEKLGKPDSAIIYYQKSLELSRMLENPYDITQTLINIGGIYKESGDYDNALAHYNEALQTNYQTERPISIAENLMRLAEVAIENGDLNNAQGFYQEALSWMKKADAPQELVELYLSIAELKLEEGHFTEAKKYVTDARNISRESFTTQLYQAHNVLGEIYKAEGKPSKSLEEYRRAYALYANRGISSKITPTMNLARAYNNTDSDSAFIFANEAFSLIDSIRTNVAGLTFRSGLFREYAGFYNEVASWYVTQKNDPRKAFELVEAAKARVLMDELAEAQENVYAKLDESTLIKKQQKAKKIDQLHQQLESSTSKEDPQSIQQQLKDAEFEYQSYLNEIQAGNKQLQNFQYPEPIKLSQVQEMLNSETAILEFTFTESGLLQLVITHNDILATYTDSVQQKDSRAFFTERVRSFRNAITEERSLAEIEEQGGQLFLQLIPSFSENEDISSLVIIPDGPLSYLPFEALQNSSRFLVEDYLVKYLPSSSIYPFIKAPHRLTNHDLLALAGSGFESEQNAASSASSQASFASLPSTLLEVDAIAKNFELSTVLKNEDVTEANLKSHDLSHFRFLHFATHANVDEVNPSRSGLLLSKKADVESLFGEDGHLNSREISNLQLNADLVTLSACNTGMGKQVTGEGLIGLQRSFLSAGASAVMVSLWSVFDKSTSIFMASFYDHLLTHEAEDYGLWSETMDWFGWYEHPLIDYKTKAIRDAKLALINHPYYNHPVHWAPFILIGK